MKKEIEHFGSIINKINILKVREIIGIKVESRYQNNIQFIFLMKISIYPSKFLKLYKFELIVVSI